MSSFYSKTVTLAIIGIFCGAAVMTVLLLALDRSTHQATPPTPQKTKLSPLSNNVSLQYHNKVDQSGSLQNTKIVHIIRSSRVTTSDLNKLSDRMVDEMCKLDSVFRRCNVIPQRCTVVVVIPKCTVVVKGDLKTSPLSKVVEKNIKKEVILERGGRTDIFDLEVFE